MILSLRRRHRWLTTILSVLLPLAFVAALFARKVPRANEASAAFPALAPTLSQVLLSKNDLWPNHNISTRVCGDAHLPTQLTLELQPLEELKAPEVLIYWSPQNAGAPEVLLHEAYLLGTLAGKQKRTWLLPEAALRADGTLIMYSLGYQKILATTALPVLENLRGGMPQ